MTGLANDLNISEAGYVVHDGAGVFNGRTFQAGTGITLTNASGVAGNTTISSTASLTDLHTARFIVASSTLGTGANFTTIAAAIASAQGTGINSTIFLQPGTYTENISLVPGIDICSYSCDATTPNVTIVGNLTLSTAGTVSISGVRLQTNSAALLTVSGSAASIFNLNNCYLNCSNNTGITFSSSSASARINITKCQGNLGTTGIGLFAHSSAGNLNIEYCNITNTGSSVTASTASAGELNILFSYLEFPITTSGTNLLQDRQSHHNTSAINTTSLTVGGSGANVIRGSTVTSGSASSISIGSTLICDGIRVSSTNTNAITGAGTITYSAIHFGSTSSTINTSTQLPLILGPTIFTNSISFDSGTNLLSNYSTSSWTPNLQINGSNTGITYSVQTGGYTRIGNVVNIYGFIALTSKGASVGNVTVSNLPIATSTNGANQRIVIPTFQGFTAAGYTTLALALNTSSTVANVQCFGSALPGANITNANLDNTFLIIFSGMYILD